MLEYNMTKNIFLIAFRIFEFLHCIKLIWMWYLFLKTNLFLKQIKFNQFKFKILRIVNF